MEARRRAGLILWVSVINKISDRFSDVIKKPENSNFLQLSLPVGSLHNA